MKKKILLIKKISKGILTSLIYFFIIFSFISTKGCNKKDENSVSVDSQGRLNITQFEITWTFDKDYQAGQFVNGDYWVVGPVTIVNISKPSNMPERDGSMINPIPDSATHGYDGRVGEYDPDLDVSTKLPNLIVNPDASLISTISRVPEETERAKRRPALEVAAILTVLSTPPPGNSFRPPYAGINKKIYSANNLQKYIFYFQLSF